MTPLTVTEAARSPAKAIPLSEPSFQGNEWQYLKECLDTGWVSSAGPFVERFERTIAAYAGTRHAVATINGTAALHIALKVVGVEPGDEVLVSALTFVAPVNAIRYCGGHPVLVDADPATWQMDPDQVARFLRQTCQVRKRTCYNRRTGRRVRAILPVHILGLACEITRLVELARHYHLRVVEDAAEAMGVRYRGQHVGTFGDAGILSFNGNKVITAGGGGMLITNDGRLADEARYLTTQAKDDELESIHREVGYNYRLTNLQAAVGLAQLEQLDRFLAKKRAIAQRYREACQALDGVDPIPMPPFTEPTYWLFTFLLSEQTTVAERQAVIRQFHQRGIGVRPLWCPIHRLSPYRRCARLGTTVAETLYRRAISLPSSVGLTETEVDRCIEALHQLVRR